MAKRKGTVRTYHQANRLIELVAAAGGKTEAEAVADAKKYVKTLKGFAMEGVETAIHALELFVRETAGSLSEPEAQDVLSYVDRLAMLGSAFDLERLLEATCSLGDLVSGLAALGEVPQEPVAIHVGAMRLFAPNSALISAADAQKVLAELQRVRKHFLRSSPVPENEAYRQAVLDRLGILDRPPQEPFDRLTKLAAQYFKVPIALISLVDRDRQWFMARCGLEVEETERDIAFCAHAIMTDEPLVVLDAKQDSRFAASPLVLTEPHIRFYAGAPLVSPDGARIGTFCIVDISPRQSFEERDRQILMNFARRTVELIYAQVLETLSRSSPGDQLEHAREVVQASTEARARSLNVLLAAIEGQLRNIEELNGSLRSDLGPQGIEAVSAAVAASARMVQGAVRAAFEASGSGELPRQDEANDVAGMISECLLILGPRIGAKSLSVRLETERAPPLRVDRVQMEQMILALIAKGVEECGPGGVVRIGVVPGAFACEFCVGTASVQGTRPEQDPDEAERQIDVPEIADLLIRAQGGSVRREIDCDGVRWRRLRFPSYRIAERKAATGGGRSS